MLTSIDVKFIFNSACLSASLGDRFVQFCKYSPNSRCRRSNCLLAVLQVWANSSPISFSWNEWNVPPFCIHYQNDSNLILLHHWRHHFTYRKILPNLVNSSWFWWIIRGILANQKRKMKYFEWIIISKYWMRLSRTDVENCVDWRRRYYSKSQRHQTSIFGKYLFGRRFEI